MQSVRDGRDLHIFLGLFKYITENLVPSERLLEELRATKPPITVLVESFV